MMVFISFFNYIYVNWNCHNLISNGERNVSAHRSNLLKKDYAFYSEYGWTEPLDLPYIWPKGK